MRDDLLPGRFLAFTDHINFSGFNPLATEREGEGWPDALPLDGRAVRRGPDGARSALPRPTAGVPLATGVAGYWMGPSFETPAEIQLAQSGRLLDLLQLFLPEVVAAYHAGHAVVAFTFVSTMSAGIAAPIALERVLDATRRAHDDFSTIVSAAIPVL